MEALDPDLRLPDGGPVYVETLPLATLHHRAVAEPWNTATSLLYLVLAIVWWIRLRRTGGLDPFMRFALPVLGIGGIGGTLYHGTRSLHLWLLMDMLPIAILVVGSGILLWRRIAGARWWWPFMVIVPASALIRAGVGILPGNILAMLAYGFLSATVLLPLVLRLRATAWQGAGTAGLALAAFAIALVCRTVDPWSAAWIVVGTHLFWHLGGLAACHFLIAYLVADARRVAARV